MAGTFGYELNPEKLSTEEKEEITVQIQQYKKYAELIQSGKYYRLSNPFQDAYVAWMFLSEDAGHALLNIVMQEVHGNMGVSYVKLKGLSRDAVYEDVESGRCYSGAALMEAGLPIPVEYGEYLSYQMEFIKKEKP